MTASLVTPGMKVSTTSECEAGEGTIERDGTIISTVIGQFLITEGIGSVAATKMVNSVSIGDTVICEITRLNEKNGEAQILVIEGQTGSIIPDQLYGQFRVTDLVDRYMHQTSDAVRRRDICRAEVKQVSPVVSINFRDRDDCGVLHAICPPCGNILIAELNGDWNVKCPNCDYQSFRALADNFAAGWAELDEGVSALNNPGKRWGKQAEALFAKGPSGRATFIAADVREDGREKSYFRFESEGGKAGGRRDKPAPGTRLFVGGLPREVTTEQIRDLFEKHGVVKDCFLPAGDGTPNKGFGFITFASKDEATAAISALNSHKIGGRRIAVKDADDDSKKGNNKRKDPEGTKVYVGNLPFKATEEAIKKHFEGTATINGMALATDKNTGKPKGFAFIWIAEGDKGEAIVAKMNGSELMGRKIKVDLAQGGKKSSPAAKGGDGKPAKSNRELQAMREEEQDSNKPRRRPHPKKE